jgi:hypothetical protein
MGRRFSRDINKTPKPRLLAPEGPTKLSFAEPSQTCATRAFTNFLINAVGNAFSIGNWTVPLDTVNPPSSSLNFSITDAVGNKLQCFENPAYHTNTFFVLNAGIW